MLASWVPGTKAVLAANPNYRGYTWDFEAGDDARDADVAREMRGKKMPQIGRVELSVIEEDAAYWLAFLRGDVDVVSLLPRFQAASMSGGDLKPELKAKGLSMYRVTVPAVTYTAFDFRDPTVGGFEREKIALRRAIALAYDIDDEINVLLHGNAERARMPIPPGVVGHDPNYRSSIGHDPDLANRLLDRFGYKRGPDGFRRTPDGRPLTLVRNTSAGTYFRDWDEIWNKSMQRIGIRIAFRTMTPAETYKAATTCTIPLFTQAWNADYPDGENFMQIFYGPNSGQTNPGCYRSPAYDALYERAQRLPDGAERNALFVEMARRLEADSAIVLGAYTRAIIVQQPWVQGHKRHPILNTVLQYIDVKPH
jgi:ABC-type transport system substrate-binding protein